MIIELEEECLRELYEEGKTKHKKYKNLPKDIVQRFVKTIQKLKIADRIEDLFLYNSLNYEKLKGDKKGIESVRVNNKYRIEFISSIEETDETPPTIITICSIIELNNHYS